MSDQSTPDTTMSPQEASETPQPAPLIDQKEEAAKAIRFLAIKAAIFIIIPVIASALAVFFLL